MTCIVGLEHEGKVYIGGDSATVSDLDVAIVTEPKVFTNGPLVMGFTTSWRMGQLLHYSLVVPDHDPRTDDMVWLVNDLTDAIRNCFKDKGYMKKADDVEEGGTFLLGYKGVLYYVGSDFQVMHPRDGYAACGCGESYALGVMSHFVRNKLIKQPTKAIEHALDAAECHSGGVLKPYTILSM
jgi:ATP-dependent protease HslVU (ClpYQ) peptidase subunit